MSRHNGRKRRKKNARRRAGRVEKRSTLSTPSEIPGDPSLVDKVPDFFNTTPPTEADETVADDGTVDAESLLGEVPAEAVGELGDLLDHLRVSPAKVSNGESSEKIEKGNSPKIGRPPVFDEIAKAKVLGLITAGVNQATAAAYVGVARSTITKALRRDPEFAREVAQAQAAAKVHPLMNIIKQSGRSFTAARYLYEKVQPHTDLTDRAERKAAATRREAQREAEAARPAHWKESVHEILHPDKDDHPPTSESNGSSPPTDNQSDV